MGKTADGAVWLNADRKSPYEYWQFWRNTEDADVGRFLRLFTELSRWTRSKRLEALKAHRSTRRRSRWPMPQRPCCMAKPLRRNPKRRPLPCSRAAEPPQPCQLSRFRPAELFGDYLVAAAFTAAGLTESNGEARRLIKQGAAKINDQQVKDQNATLAESDVVDGSIKLSAGKKRHALVKPV